MSTDPHTPLPQSGPLNDQRPTDMPAARSMVVIVVLLLAVFSVVAAVIYYDHQEEAPDPSPRQEQESPNQQ